jgi:hypothetical protein
LWSNGQRFEKPNVNQNDGIVMRGDKVSRRGELAEGDFDRDSALSGSTARGLLLFRMTFRLGLGRKKRGHRNEACASAMSSASRRQASPADRPGRDRRAGAGSSRRLRTKHLCATAANAAYDLAGERITLLNK